MGAPLGMGWDNALRRAAAEEDAAWRRAEAQKRAEGRRRQREADAIARGSLPEGWPLRPVCTPKGSRPYAAHLYRGARCARCGTERKP